MALFNFDYKGEPLASHGRFMWRLLINIIAAFVLVAIALGVGMYGYTATENMAPIDAFLNSAMLLGGMGPVDPPLHTDAGKLFAGFYSLGCGRACRRCCCWLRQHGHGRSAHASR